MKKINPNPPQMKISWYSSPEDVHRAMWDEIAQSNEMTYEELIAESIGEGETESGELVSFSHEQEIQGMREQGCWAFVDIRSNHIHAWASEKASPDMILHMLAHEIGHATGEKEDDEFQEEMRAEQFGRCAKLAYSLMPTRKPVAWRMFDGEGGYMYTDDEETATNWRAYLGEKSGLWLTSLYE